ncbi:MAG: beta-galactosidase [Opitutales bacterium]
MAVAFATQQAGRITDKDCSIFVVMLTGLMAKSSCRVLWLLLAIPASITAAEPAQAELRGEAGDVEVYVDGVLQSRMWGRLALPGQNAPEKLGQYQPAGIEVYLTNLDLEWNIGWNGDDTYDYRPYETHLDRILSVDPDAKLVLYVGYAGAAPYRWAREHEDQLVRLANGDRLRMGSFASEKWLRDHTAAMKRFVTHFRNSPYADNIIGINPIMYSNEWHTPSSRMHPPLDDYSEPMRQYFRSWLRDKYKEVDTLREAWEAPDVTFAKVEIPSQRRRLRTDMERLPFGDWDQRVLDYEQCLSEARERFIIATCKAIKEASGGALLTSLSRNPESLMMLRSEWVDCFHGPYAYKNRKLMNVFSYAYRSYPLNGKLGMYQIDTGTHVMPKTGGDSLGIGYIWPGPYRLADTEWESVEILERDVSRAIADNRYVYWNEGGPGWMFPVVNHGTVTYGRLWFDTPAIKQLIVNAKALVDRLSKEKPGSTAKVAVISAEFQDPYLGISNQGFNRMFGNAETLFALQRSGVTSHQYILEDFEAIQDAYDVYIFTNAFYVPSKLRERIRKKLSADGATAIWLYGAGFLDENGASLENIEALTGFRLRVEHGDAPIQIASPGSQHALFSGVSRFGSRTASLSNSSDQPLKGWVPETEPRDLPARFYGDDPQATVLATFESGGRPGMLEKNIEGIRSIWIGAPEVPWQLYRNLMAQAGVHVYSETGDYLMANEHFVALYCLSGGEKVISLPERYQILDALTGEELETASKEIRFDARAGETRSFILNSRVE